MWEQWVDWSAREECGESVVLTECYEMAKTREIEASGMGSAYPWKEAAVNL